ncbi:MAG: lipocalin family protein [Rhodanobacter sp.]
MLRHAMIPILAAAILTVAPADAAVTNTPVPSLDLQRYVGQWHEIAHLPMFFQRRCADHITATYTPKPDGTIAVQNACREKNGKLNASDGVAKPVPGQPGALKVRFAPRILAWLPWVWADYWVVELDPGYQWAVVGGPGRKYLWILSRSPSMDSALFDRLRERARERGYPVDKLVMASSLN